MAKGLFPKEEAKRSAPACARASRRRASAWVSTTASAAPEQRPPSTTCTSRRSSDTEPVRAKDPYAELKTRVHHEVIATLGAELFKQDANEDMTERVFRAVTEQLALDRTPLTREERRQLVREITDDILGYGPLEPFLRDDTVTEVMVNALRPDLRRASRARSSARRRRSSTTRT